jgi:3-deoxy-7-phosphoheptulonate synthase
MIVSMQMRATKEDVDRVVARIQESGLRAHVDLGEERTVIGVVGSVIPPDLQGKIEALPGVHSVTRITAPYKLVSREFKSSDTIVQVGDVRIGSDEFVVMAGPCSVESRDQLLTTARVVKRLGARILRGGAFKPRTSPYSFQGLGEDGLKLLAEARAETGLPVITEVLEPGHVELVCRYADILQIGARNMQNFPLLREVGKTRKPVMLKRGLSATIEEWLLSAEYIMDGGNYQVILCERGIRTFETAVRNTMDLCAIPVVRGISHLPIIADPSHATGKRKLVKPMAMAAAAAGADGLIVEVHPNPDAALSDGPQSLDLDMFADLMRSLDPIVVSLGRHLAPAVLQALAV